jgi:cation:H+ antiporter
MVFVKNYEHMLIGTIGLLIIGLLILAKAADYLVDGASSLAKRLSVPPLVIGLTIVAFGTSMPELIVSLLAASRGSMDIALGNVIGSNIFNILVILGLCSIITPLKIKSTTVWKEIPFSFAAAVSVLFLGLYAVFSSNKLPSIDLNSATDIGVIGFSGGVILLLFFIIFMYYSFGLAKNDTETQSEEGGEEIHSYSNLKSGFYILGGLIGLVVAGKIVVDQAVVIAQFAGLSEKFIGLTIVSAGTSLPELVTSIRATQKGQDDIAIGNVVGSNIFNIFFILGITSLITPVPIDGQNIFDILVLFVSTILLFVFNFLLKRFSLGKFEGLVFLLGYIGYVTYLFVR